MRAVHCVVAALMFPAAFAWAQSGGGGDRPPVSAALKAAFEACQAQGHPGDAAFDACMASKGFKKPEGAPPPPQFGAPAPRPPASAAN